jgi:peroxiredoxin
MRLLSLALALGLSAALLPGQALRRAPGFALLDIDQRLWDLGDYRGKVVLLDLMQTNCAHCIPFAKVLDQVKARYGAKVQVLSVVTAPDNAATIRAFLSANKVTFPLLFDCGQVMYSYVRPSPAKPTVEFPRLYIINPAGMIVHDYAYGAATEDVFTGKRLYQDIDALLGRAAAPKK